MNPKIFLRYQKLPIPSAIYRVSYNLLPIIIIHGRNFSNLLLIYKIFFENTYFIILCGYIRHTKLKYPGHNLSVCYQSFFSVMVKI